MVLDEKVGGAKITEQLHVLYRIHLLYHKTDSKPSISKAEFIQQKGEVEKKKKNIKNKTTPTLRKPLLLYTHPNKPAFHNPCNEEKRAVMVKES